MRVTNKMMAQTVLNNLYAAQRRLMKTQDQLSSLQVVSRPSDDPVVAARVLSLNTVMVQNEQYGRNIADALSWVEMTETALGKVNDVLQRARELAVYGASGTLEDTSRRALAEEVGQLLDNAVELANTSLAGRYIFGGTRTDAPPFSYGAGGAIEYGGDENRLSWEIAQGVVMEMSVDGKTAFLDSGVFSALQDLRDDLLAGKASAVGGGDLAALDQTIDKILNLRAALGARANRLEALQSQMEGEQVNYQALKSKLNDVDLAAAVTEYKMNENAYQAALNVGARIILPSLVDYLLR